MGAPDDDDDGATETLEEKVERLVSEREAAAERKRNRTKDPKDFGEFLDRVADTVIERIEERGAQRRKAADDDDQEPARGKSTSAFQRWWTGGGDDD